MLFGERVRAGRAVARAVISAWILKSRHEADPTCKFTRRRALHRAEHECRATMAQTVPRVHDMAVAIGQRRRIQGAFSYASGADLKC